MAIHVRDNRGGNWFWLHNAIIDQYGAELGAYGIAVYCCLCRHVGQDQYTWVSQKELAAEIGSSRRQVQRELTKLQELGLLTVEEQENEHGQTSNTYTLLAPPRASQTRGDDHQAHPPRQEGAPLQLRNKTQGRRAPQPGQNGRHGYDYERLVETPGLDDADAAE